MRPPAGLPHLPALRSAAALALLAPFSGGAAETRADLNQEIKASLPRYDPTIRERDLAAKAASTVPPDVPAPVPLPGNPAEHGVSGTNPGTAGAPREEVLELPKVTVRANSDRPKPIPRMTAPKPLRDLRGEPLESGSAKDARLIKKHLSFLDQLLNSHNAQVALAREAEAREQQVNFMNGLADAIELDTAVGRDPAQIKKLRDEYEKLYYSGPK